LIQKLIKPKRLLSLIDLMMLQPLFFKKKSHIDKHYISAFQPRTEFGLQRLLQIYCYVSFMHLWFMFYSALL